MLLTASAEIDALSAADRDRELEVLLAAAPVEERERLARRCFSPSALRQCRLAERDAMIRRLAAGILSDSGAPSAHARLAKVFPERCYRDVRPPQVHNSGKQVQNRKVQYYHLRVLKLHERVAVVRICDRLNPERGIN